jgi:glycerol-3-phosphate dehydrogenase
VREIDCDLLVVGGGINGCGIARDAAGRGLRIVLAEKGDLAGGTSSASTKLIHGGLRYLEYYDFRLVREALIEREVLLRAAPHIIWPMRFVLPHRADLRPAWLIRLGLFLYDHLGGRRLLPATATVDLSKGALAAGLKQGFAKGFEYSDCWVDDARLVVLNAMDARDRGATIFTGTEVVEALPRGKNWSALLRPTDGAEPIRVTARGLVNATGPWAGDFLASVLGRKSASPIRLVKGSHIVVPRLFAHDRAFIFQNEDGRIVFAIPYEDDFTLIGTTDLDYTGDPAAVAITDPEIEYLCASVGAYTETPVSPGDVAWSYSGVRPLYDDGASEAQMATRDYVLDLDTADGGPPVVNIFGGKITTFRRLSEHALEKILGALEMKTRPWTAGASLPGGDFAPSEVEARVGALAAEFPFLPAGTPRRLVRAYGTRAASVLAGARDRAALGTCFGADLYQREVDYLVREEWARTADDILWRRTKLGLRIDAAGQGALAAYLSNRPEGSSKHGAMRAAGAVFGADTNRFQSSNPDAAAEG